MRTKCYVDVRNGVTRSITPACDSCIESCQRFLAPFHASVRNRQTKAWPPGKLSRLFVEGNGVIEPSRLAIQRCQCRLSIVSKGRIELECALSGFGGCVASFRVGLEWRHKGIGQPQPRLCSSSPRTTELRILLQCAVEKFQASPQLGLGVLVRINDTPQISVVGSCAPGRTRRRDREFELESVDNGTRDLIL